MAAGEKVGFTEAAWNRQIVMIVDTADRQTNSQDGTKVLLTGSQYYYYSSVMLETHSYSIYF